MATERQIAANRRNAQRSTGPRTAEGKARAARNGSTHNLAAKSLALTPEEQPIFDEMQHELAAEISPQSPAEDLAVTQLLHAAWRLRRCFDAEITATHPDSLHRYHAAAESSFYRALNALRDLQTARVTAQTPCPAEVTAEAINLAGKFAETDLNHRLAALARAQNRDREGAEFNRKQRSN